MAQIDVNDHAIVVALQRPAPRGAAGVRVAPCVAHCALSRHLRACLLRMGGDWHGYGCGLLTEVVDWRLYKAGNA